MTRSVTNRAVAAFLAATLAVGPGLARVASADDAAFASADERELAKAHFKLGRSYQDARAYDRAIIEYQASYAISPMPELLFNIGQCYRLRGEPRSALVYYQRYLQLVPDGGASDEARVHVEALRRQVAALPPSVAGARLVPTVVPIAGEDEQGTSWRWVGAGGAFVGLALTGVGFWYGLEAQQAAARLENARGPFTPELQEVQRQGRDAQTRMLLFTGAGVTLMAAGGLTWWLSGGPEPRTPRLTASPIVGPGQAGFAVAGSF